VLTLLSENRSFAGAHRRYRHRSALLDCAMTLAVYLPPQALAGASVPALYWLSGLTCTDENFMQKAGAHRLAASLGLALIAPDTSPRGPEVPGDPEGAWDFGHGAGFYLNATESPWARHYRMHDYVVEELPELLERELPLSHPGLYRSVSAFAPISHPSRCPWGEKAFSRYLGPDRSRWREWDACELIVSAPERLPLLIDQGLDDPFLERQLRPDDLEAAARSAGHPLELRRQPGYDHSYFFIASFIDDHLRHHAAALLPPA
jgi:S-formylglutathione hydrolase